MDTVDIDIESQVEYRPIKKRFTMNIHKFITVLFLGTIMSLIMMKRPLLCKSNDYVIFGYENNHMSQHMIDPYSITHTLHGLIMFRIFSQFIKNDMNLLCTIVVSCVWEIIENTPMIINMYRQDAVNAGYYGDSVLNSTSDILFSLLGWLISANISLFWSIIIYIISDCICMLWIGDNLIRNIFILSNTVDITILLISSTWIFKLVIEGAIFSIGAMMVKKLK